MIDPDFERRVVWPFLKPSSSLYDIPASGSRPLVFGIVLSPSLFPSPHIMLNHPYSSKHYLQVPGRCPTHHIVRREGINQDRHISTHTKKTGWRKEMPSERCISSYHPVVGAALNYHWRMSSKSCHYEQPLWAGNRLKGAGIVHDGKQQHLRGWKWGGKMGLRGLGDDLFYRSQEDNKVWVLKEQNVNESQRPGLGSASNLSKAWEISLQWKRQRRAPKITLKVMDEAGEKNQFKENILSTEKLNESWGLREVEVARAVGWDAWGLSP